MLPNYKHVVLIPRHQQILQVKRKLLLFYLFNIRTITRIQ